MSRLIAFVASMGAFLALRGWTAAWGLPGLALAQWGGLVAVPVLVLAARGQSVARTVGWRLPRVRDAWGAVVLGAAGLPVAWTAHWLQSLAWPGAGGSPSPSLLEAGPGGAAGVMLLILLAALTPAICEELAFRGLLQRELAQRLSGPWAVGGAALFFALLHAGPEGASRVLPAFAAGVLPGWAAWRTGSLPAAVLVHLTHNLTVLAVAASLGGGGVVWSDPGSPPLFLVLAGVALVAAGTQILGPSTRDATITPKSIRNHGN